LKEKIDGIDVRQSGARLTPLYESLSYAKQRLSEYERQLSATSKKMIVVISDGVNFDPESKLKFEDWKGAWLRDAGSPAVFLYQYEGEKSEDKGEQTAVIRKGEQERSTLVNDKFYRNSENLFKTFEELERAVIELFPRVKVNLHPGDAIDAASDRFVGSKIPVRIGQAERRYQVWLDGGAPSGQLPSGEDCSEKQEAVFAPGEYIQLECKGAKLLPVPFQEDLGLKDGFLGPAIEVDKKYYCKSTEMGGELQLRIGVDRKDFPLEKPRRPKFCCAWIKVGEEGFPYADFSFKAGTHHPLVEFAPVRFPGQLRTRQEKKSSYRVWVAEEWPDSMLPDDVKFPMEKVAQDVEVNLPGAWNLKGTIEKKEGRVTIRVVEGGFRPEVFFFCRSRRTEEFAQAKRMFTKDRTKQEHFFSIPSSEWNDYEVVCLSTEKLKELQETGVVLGFEVPSDELKN